MWYVNDRGQTLGPLSSWEIVDRWRAGHLSAGAQVCPVGGREWVPIGSHPAFSADLARPMPAAQPAETSMLAIFSLISGLVSWVAIPVLAALVAILLGHLARGEIRASLGRKTGSGVATAGMVLGYANIAVAALGTVLLVLAYAGAFGVLMGLEGAATAPGQ